MDHELTPEERDLIEREFIARQDLAARRRSFARHVFIVGLSAGLFSAALGEFHVSPLGSSLLYFAWFISVVVYVGLGVFPGSFGKDMDPSWHLNPWAEALQHLSEGRTQVEAVALMAGPYLGRMLFTFLYFGLK